MKYIIRIYSAVMLASASRSKRQYPSGDLAPLERIGSAPNGPVNGMTIDPGTGTRHRPRGGRVGDARGESGRSHEISDAASYLDSIVIGRAAHRRCGARITAPRDSFIAPAPVSLRRRARVEEEAAPRPTLQ